MSGGSAPWGEAQVRSMRLYADEINSRGGLPVGDTFYTIEVITCDARYSSAGGVACAQQLVAEQGIKWVVGPIGSAECLGWQTVAEPLKAISIIPMGCWGEGIIGSKNPGTLRHNVSFRERGAIEVQWLKENLPQARKVAFIAINDATGQDSTQQLVAALRKIGHHEVVAQEYVARGTQDYYPAITGMLLKQPELIFPVVLPDGDQALFFKQLWEQGYKGLKVGGCSDQPLCNELGSKEAFEGNYSFILDRCSKEQGTPQELAWCQSYQAKYGERPGDYAFNSPEAMDIMFSMMRGAGTVSGLAAAIQWYEGHPLEVSTFLGTKARLGGKDRYGIMRQTFTTMGVARILSGKIVPTSPYRSEVRYEP